MTCADLRARQAALVDYDLDYDHSFFGDIPDPCSGDIEAEGTGEAPDKESAAADKIREMPSADAHGRAERAAGAAGSAGTGGSQAGGAAKVGADSMHSGGASNPGTEGAQAAEAPDVGADILQPSGAAEAVGGSAKAAGILGPIGRSAVGAGGGLSTAKARVAEVLAARDVAQGLAAGSGIGGARSGKQGAGGGLDKGRDAVGEERKLPLSQRMRVSIRSAAGDQGDRHARSAASVKVLVEILDWIGEPTLC